MSKLTYCANCGLRLNVYRKAIPKYGRIVDLIEPHECSEEPVEFDITPTDIPVFQPSEKDNKFVKKLNELTPPVFPDKALNLQDRRPSDQVKSTAPESLLNFVKDASPTPLANVFTDPDEIIERSKQGE